MFNWKYIYLCFFPLSLISAPNYAGIIYNVFILYTVCWNRMQAAACPVDGPQDVPPPFLQRPPLLGRRGLRPHLAPLRRFPVRPPAPGRH